MKSTIAMIVFFIGCLLGLYVGGWMMFLKPIINAVTMYDAGILTGAIIFWTVIKCIFAGFVGTVIACIGLIIASIISK